MAGKNAEAGWWPGQVGPRGPGAGSQPCVGGLRWSGQRISWGECPADGVTIGICDRAHPMGIEMVLECLHPACSWPIL